MDNDDAQCNNQQIRHFGENSESLTNLPKQQLYVVKSSLGAITDTLSDIEYNKEKVKNCLLQIKNYIDSVVSNTRRTTDILSAKVTVEGHIARVNEALNVLQRNSDIQIDSIVNARQGILQPEVVLPSLLIDALTKIIPSFPKDTTIPFHLSKNSANLLYKICDFHVYISEGILGYVITLPLISRGTFKIFKMIPIPAPMEQNKFLYIDTDESILCLDQTRQCYFMITNDELEGCKILNPNSYTCKQNHPLMSSHSKESCAVKLPQPTRDIP
jgi:hypothetical protein